MCVISSLLDFIFALVGLLFEKPRPECPDPGAWDKVDLLAEDQSFLMELTDQQ